jgi:hypothetical protein
MSNDRLPLPSAADRSAADTPAADTSVAHGAAPSSAPGERLLRRRTAPVGLIDVRQPQQLVARTSGWVAERFGWLDAWKTKYVGTEDRPTSDTPSQALPLGMTGLREARMPDAQASIAAALASRAPAGFGADSGPRAGRGTNPGAIAPPLATPQFRVKRAGTPAVAPAGAGNPLVIARKPAAAPARPVSSVAPAMAPASTPSMSSTEGAGDRSASGRVDGSAASDARGDRTSRAAGPGRAVELSSDDGPSAESRPLLRRVARGGAPATVTRRATPETQANVGTLDRATAAARPAGDANAGANTGGSSLSTVTTIARAMATGSRTPAALPLQSRGTDVDAARTSDSSPSAATRVSAASESGPRSTPVVSARSLPLASSTSIQRASIPATTDSRAAGSPEARVPVAAETRADRTAAAASPMVFRQAVSGSGAAGQASSFDANRGSSAGMPVIGAAPHGSTTIARQDSSSGTAAASADANAGFAAAASAGTTPGLNIARVADEVARLLGRRVTIERERRGRGPWR